MTNVAEDVLKQIFANIEVNAVRRREAQERVTNPRRYKIVAGKLVEDPEGEVVLYADHFVAIEQMKRENNKAYRDGKAAGTPEHSWRL